MSFGEAYEPDEMDFYSWSSKYIEDLRKKGIVRYVTSYDEYRKLTRSKPLVVAVYTTPTCSACAIYKPIYYIVAEEYTSNNPDVAFLEVDAYYAPEAAYEVGVMATPTTIFFVNGRPVDGVVGVLDEDSLKEMIEEVRARAKKG